MTVEIIRTHETRLILAPRLVRAGSGILAGLLAGLIYGALLSSQHMSPMMSPTDLPGDSLTHLLLSMLLGLSFGLMLDSQALTSGTSLIWGAAFGVVWWLVGPLTLFPLLHGTRPDWSVVSAQHAFPLLIGLAVVFGACMGLCYWVISVLIARRSGGWREGVVRQEIGTGAISGGLAGLIGGWVFGQWMGEANFYPLIAGLVNSIDPTTGRWLHLGFSVVIGMSYGVLFRGETRSPGSSIAWGMVYGLVWWVVGMLTFLPVLLGNGVQWSLTAAQAAFPALIGHLMFGITLGFTQSVLSQIWRTLFVESDPLLRQPEGPGTRGLRGLALGAAASVGGGLVFTIVMLATNALPTIARITGMSSILEGFIVHMGISTLIGAAYGLLFRQESATPHQAVGWGLVYGFIWWLLGPLTLLPLLLGSTIQWSVASAAQAFPSLVGHFLYGVVLAVGLQILLARYSPNRKPRTTASLTDASQVYALWLVVTLLTLMIVLIIASPPLR